MPQSKKHITSFKNSFWYKTDINYAQTELKIDQSSGVIRDVAVCTVGEAKGHDINLDQSFINRIVELGNQNKQGLKCRFGHPNMSAESLGTYLGRFKNFRISGPKAIADLYLDDVAKKSPGGDLYTWVLEMAAKNPDQFGSSIVFAPGPSYQVDGEGNRVPPHNEDEPVYATCEDLHGADIVDEPAANDGGLFSSSQFNSQKFAVRVTEFLDRNPDVWQFVESHPDKFKPFLEKYAQYQKKKSHISMSKHIKPQRRGFFSKFSAAFAAAINSNETFATTDATTTDGATIRIVSVNEEPAVGDEVYIIAEDGSESVASDGDYTIAGGNLDGYVISVFDGFISAIVVPVAAASTDPAPAAPIVTQQSSKEKEDQLRAENDTLKQQLKDKTDELEAFKRKPLAEHTAVGGDEDTIGNIPAAEKDHTFWNQPWNKKYKK